MNKKPYIIFLCTSIITMVSATGPRSLIHRENIARTLGNHCLVRHGITMQPCEDEEECIFYRANNCLLPLAVVTTGVFGIAHGATMNSSFTIPLMISGASLLGSSVIKGIQVIENCCERCKPSEDDELINDDDDLEIP